MKAVGEVAPGITWIAPCASSLVRLTKEGSAAWEKLRGDPGAVLLVARSAGADSVFSLAGILDGIPILQHVQDSLRQSSGWLDWSASDIVPLYQSSLRQAALAYSLARVLRTCDAEKAWIGGLLASLGWFALGSLQPEAVGSFMTGSLNESADLSSRAAILARRLAREWGLPIWLRPIVGQLSFNPSIARKLTPELPLFQIVQLATAIVQQEQGIPLHANLPDRTTLQRNLAVSNELAELAQREAKILECGLQVDSSSWENPAQQALLPEFVEMALRMRRRDEKTLIERLHSDLETLQDALEDQQAQEYERLHNLKLSALAELAAGAGHEINNPLAVISGQAQYALRQISQAENELVEDATALAVLHELRTKLDRSLHTVVGQAQRIHHVLTDLMQFARPNLAKRQPVRLGDLLRETVQAAQPLAESRKVRLALIDPPEDWQIEADRTQVGTAVSALLRNAIEAVTAEGWTGVRAERRGSGVAILVEDNGPGPSPLALEHMFDPFFSGRSAGRGRGLGLPTAWRLVQQNGGEVRYEGIDQGKTRFAIVLPELNFSMPVNGQGLYVEPARNGLNGNH